MREFAYESLETFDTMEKSLEIKAFLSYCEFDYFKISEQIVNQQQTNSLGKEMLNKHEREVISSYQKTLTNYINRLDVKFQKQLNELMTKYRKLGELQKYSFDYDLNLSLRFIASIDMAKLVGVPENEILKNNDEIDNYFLG